jgi:hypothetical protein
MATLVFDDLGNMWPASAQRFRTTFAIPMNDPLPGKYAVKVLGLVAIDVFGRSLQLRCMPAIASEAAVMAAIAWLRRQTFDRIAIDYYDHGWTLAVVRSADAAEAMLSSLVSRADRAQTPIRISKQNTTQPAKSGTAFSMLLAEWHAAMSGQMQIEPMNLAQRYLGDRYVIDELRSDGEIVYKDIGPGFHYFGRGWIEKSRGQPICQQPDRDYGHWVKSHYREALEKNEPRIDDIDALVYNADGTRMRFCIKRVILPVIRPNHAPLLIGGSIYDDAVDLRQLQTRQQPSRTATQPTPSPFNPQDSLSRRLDRPIQGQPATAFSLPAASSMLSAGSTNVMSRTQPAPAAALFGSYLR